MQIYKVNHVEKDSAMILKLVARMEQNQDVVITLMLLAVEITVALTVLNVELDFAIIIIYYLLVKPDILGNEIYSNSVQKYILFDNYF
jgi:hypothetical protein